MKVTDAMPGTPLNRRTVLKYGGSLTIAALATPLLSPGRMRAAGARSHARGTTSLTEWGFGTDNTMAKSRIDAFNKAHPSINLTIVPEIDDQKILTAVAGGDVPDILWLDRNSIASWAARGALMQLDELIGKSHFAMNDFYPSALAQVKYNGHVWGVPQFMDVRPLWVNLDPLKEVGISLAAVEKANWDQLRSYGVKLTKKQGSKVLRWGFNTKAQDGFYWMYMWGNGGELLSADGKTASFDDAKNVEALSYLVDTVNAQGGLFSFKAFSGTWGSNAQDPFIQNQVGITLFEQWLLNVIAQYGPNHNFTAVPFKGRNGQPVSLTGGLAWAIPTGAKNPAAAWTFIQYMSALNTWRLGSRAVQAENATNKAPFIPSLTASQSSDRAIMSEFYKPISAKFDRVVKLFPYLLQHGRSIPASPVSAQITDILNNDVVLPALQGQKSPAAALKDGQSKAQQAIASFKS